MADWYVRSTTGNNDNDGSTWALAKATIQGAIGSAAAGDRVFVSKNHAETNASGTWSLNATNGTLAAPIKVLCVDDAGDPEPPTALAKTATVTNTATALTTGINVAGWSYWYGFKLICPAGNTGDINIGTLTLAGVVMEECQFHVLSPNSGRRLKIGGSSDNGPKNKLFNCWAAFGHVAQSVSHEGYYLEWLGGGLLPTSAAISAAVFSLGTSSARYHGTHIRGFDLSVAAAAVAIFSKAATDNNRGYVAELVGGNLPAGWRGALHTSTIAGPGPIIRMIRSDSAGDVKRSAGSVYAGSYRSETVNTRSGGASENGVPYSFKLETLSTALRDTADVRSPEISRMWPGNATEAAAWTAGDPVEVAIEVLTDGVTLTDADCWLEVGTLADSGSSLIEVVAGKASALAAGAAHATSAETWDTSGLTSPIRQKVSLSVSPAAAGLLSVRLVLAKPSASVYLCPKIEVAP